VDLNVLAKPGLREKEEGLRGARSQDPLVLGAHIYPQNIFFLTLPIQF